MLDRTRDIMFSDKTVYDLRSWKHMSRQVDLIEKLYAIFERNSRDMAPASRTGYGRNTRSWWAGTAPRYSQSTG